MYSVHDRKNQPRELVLRTRLLTFGSLLFTNRELGRCRCRESSYNKAGCLDQSPVFTSARSTIPRSWSSYNKASG